MIDYQNLPDNAKVDWFLQPTATTEVHTWTKPSGCNFVYIVAAGGGGYGGNGFSGAAGTARGGGGGGGAGGLNTLLVPAFLIPDTLFIRVGRGAVRATSSSSQQTIISAYRISSTTEYYLLGAGAGNGGSGTGTTIGTGGSGGSYAITNNTLGTIGKLQGITSISGFTAGAIAGAAGNNSNFGFTLSAGAGGASTTSGDFAGGNVTSQYNQPSNITVVPGGAAVSGATSGQNDGGSGFFIPKRFAFYAGAGGGASNTGVGGNGGKGGPGCGGGGGGAGVTGGAGGDGGDGFALIISY